MSAATSQLLRVPPQERKTPKGSRWGRQARQQETERDTEKDDRNAYAHCCAPERTSRRTTCSSPYSNSARGRKSPVATRVARSLPSKHAKIFRGRGRGRQKGRPHPHEGYPSTSRTTTARNDVPFDANAMTGAPCQEEHRHNNRHHSYYYRVRCSSRNASDNKGQADGIEAKDDQANLQAHNFLGLVLPADR